MSISAEYSSCLRLQTDLSCLDFEDSLHIIRFVKPLSNVNKYSGISVALNGFYDNFLLCNRLNFNAFLIVASRLSIIFSSNLRLNFYSVFCGKLFCVVNNIFIKKFTYNCGNFDLHFVDYSLNYWSAQAAQFPGKLLPNHLFSVSFYSILPTNKNKYPLTNYGFRFRPLSVCSYWIYFKVAAHFHEAVRFVLLVLWNCFIETYVRSNVDETLSDIEQSYSSVYTFTKHKCLNNNILKCFGDVYVPKKVEVIAYGHGA